MANDDKFKKVISHAKEYGYVFQSSEIYDGLSAVYDYAQNGAELKKNIRDYWWKAMVQMHDNIVGIDAAIFMHPTTWKASGHVDAFNDPLIDNKDSKKRYRADVLVEDFREKIQQKINKDITKAQKRFGDAFDEMQLLGFPLKDPFILLTEDKKDETFSRGLPDNVGKVVTIVGYLVTVKNTATHNGKSMYFGTFIDRHGEWLDTVHFPSIATKYPFRGRGLYSITGTVTEEFNCINVECLSMYKMPIIEDPRYAESDTVTRIQKHEFRNTKKAREGRDPNASISSKDHTRTTGLANG